MKRHVAALLATLLLSSHTHATETVARPPSADALAREIASETTDILEELWDLGSTACNADDGEKMAGVTALAAFSTGRLDTTGPIKRVFLPYAKCKEAGTALMGKMLLCATMRQTMNLKVVENSWHNARLSCHKALGR